MNQYDSISNFNQFSNKPKSFLEQGFVKPNKTLKRTINTFSYNSGDNVSVLPRPLSTDICSVNKEKRIYSPFDCTVENKVKHLCVGDKVGNNYTKNSNNYKSNRVIQRFNDTINATYDDDIDIGEIHKMVIDILTNKNYRKKVSIEKKIKKIKEEISKPQTKGDRILSLELYKNYNKHLKYINDKENIKEYIKRSKNYIEKYKKITNRVKITYVGEKQDEILKSDEEIEERLSIIEKYLLTVSNYVDIHIKKENNGNFYCVSCKKKLDSYSIKDSGIIVCFFCGVYNHTFLHKYSQDEEYSAMSTSVNEEFIEKIKVELNRYQCQYNVNLPKGWENSLDSYFKKNSMDNLIGSNIQKSKEKLGTNVNIMLKALKDKDTRLNSYYKDVQYICVQYWGWERQDVSHLENSIIQDCKAIYPIFLNNKDHRKSNMSYQYLLWRLLDRHNHKCSPSDFKIPQTEATLEWHENKWFLFCEKLGWDKPVSIWKK
jgi:hypothetical protein